jgi:3-dehydroquinate dehydratase-2
MSTDEMAAAVLECVGGISNVSAHSLCATRLRITLNDAEKVDRNALHAINGVLGIADRGMRSIEVIFGPNLVKRVYRSFVRLAGTMTNSHVDDAATPSQGNFQVRITPELGGHSTLHSSVGHAHETHAPADDEGDGDEPDAFDEDTSALLELLGENADESFAPTLDASLPPQAADGACLMIVNGPNVNMLSGPKGSQSDYSELLALCHKTAYELGFSWCECYQSNHEGDLVDVIQDAGGRIDALVINPSSLAPTSCALLDAIELVGIPCVEVQLLEDEQLPEYRRGSIVRHTCRESIRGKGIDGYREAITLLAGLLDLA